MILILRGHIRNTFQNNELYDFIHYLYFLYPKLQIYIHTWNIFANNISWRQIHANKEKVNKQIIIEYFKDISFLIKHIIIDDDNNIVLQGSKTGNICMSKMPKIGWKNYWYGQYRISEYVYKEIIDHNKKVINCRFDIFNNSFSLNNYEIIDFINKYNMYNFTNIKFIFEKEKEGIDNIYMGNIHTMYTMVRCFHLYLDTICNKFPTIINQEFLVYNMNNVLFPTNIRNTNIRNTNISDTNLLPFMLNKKRRQRTLKKRFHM